MVKSKNVNVSSNLKDNNEEQPTFSRVVTENLETTDELTTVNVSKSFWLNLRDEMQIKDLPTKEKVIAELYNVLKNKQFTVISHRNHMLGYYTIHANDEHDIDSLNPLM